MSALHAMLEPRGEARVALQSVEVQARLLGLLSDVTLTQTYRNLEQTPIEAVYTFPLPLDGVLLGLTLDLNGQTLKGVVQPRPSAAARYEQAVDEGDAAVLLEQLQPGLFSLNLANLLPGESARIRIRYAQLHRWQGNRLRFHLPTTLAPRYGDPLAAGLAPHQVPEAGLKGPKGPGSTFC
jgi:Ca-activated chloride channel homolog